MRTLSNSTYVRMTFRKYFCQIIPFYCEHHQHSHDNHITCSTFTQVCLLFVPTDHHSPKAFDIFWNFPLIKNYKEKKVGFHHSTHTTCRHDDDCYDEALNFTRSKSSHHRIVAVVVIFYVLLKNKCTMTDIIIMTSLSWFMIVLYEYPFVLLIPWYCLVHSFLIWWKC